MGEEIPDMQMLCPIKSKKPFSDQMKALHKKDLTFQTGTVTLLHSICTSCMV